MATPRDPIAGPDGGPEAPFPIKLSGRIIKGFQRGSKELGIPTANIPVTGLDVGGHSDIESGVYYGWAGLDLSSATADATKASEPPKPEDGKHAGEQDPTASDSSRQTEDTQASDKNIQIYPMVMSIGWNPFYKNTVRSVEVHIIHKFSEDFYNAHMNLSILAFIRHERDYDSLESLIADINTDIEVSKKSLERPAYQRLAQDPFLRSHASSL